MLKNYNSFPLSNGEQCKCRHKGEENSIYPPVLETPKIPKRIPKYLQETRMRRMVAWAQTNRPYYAKLYKDTDPNFQLSDLSPFSKIDLMAHWDEWVTDRTLTLAQVNEFI